MHLQGNNHNALQWRYKRFWQQLHQLSKITEFMCFYVPIFNDCQQGFAQEMYDILTIQYIFVLCHRLFML